MSKLKGVICCSLVLSCAASFAVEPFSRLSTYQKEVKGRTNGVYEIDGSLYIHVQIPVNSREGVSRQKMRAVAMANDLLRKWALDVTKAEREKTGDVPKGLGCAMTVLDATVPTWRNLGLNVKFKGQEHTGQDGKQFWFVQIASKEDLLKAIPTAFKEPLPRRELVCETLRAVLPKFVKGDAKTKVWQKCHAVDILPNGEFDPPANTEFENVRAQVETYLSSSPLAEEMRQSAKRICAVETNGEWLDDWQEPSVVTNVAMTTQTNRLNMAKVSTNRLERVQTPEEIASRGRATGGVVSVTEVDAISEEVVVQEVVTVTTKKVCSHRHRETLISGKALFEEIFLSGGSAANVLKSRTSRGAEAAQAYFSGQSDNATREKLLREALGENPGDCELWNLYGRCRLMQDDLLGALICFRAAIRLDASNQYVLTNLAIVYDRLKCPILAGGMSVLAYGLSGDAWCKKNAEAILFGPCQR